LDGNIQLSFVYQSIGMDDGTFEVKVPVDRRRADTVGDERGHVHLPRVLLTRPVPPSTIDFASCTPDLAAAAGLNLGDNLSDQPLHQQCEISRHNFRTPVGESNGQPDATALSNEVVPLLGGAFH
jgi:hypothetical protein